MPKETVKKGKRTSREETRAYKTFIASISAAILLSLAGIFLGAAIRNAELVRSTLLTRARSIFQEIVLARKWNAAYGGVFVIKGPGVESNPYLVDPDIAAADGRTLTKRNPALMTREISELADKEANFRLRITSLRPLNPGNAPDDFERNALGRFETGETEYWTTVETEGARVYRYMGALRTDAPCLQCHAIQGYAEGDVRGGISVSFPIDDIETNLRRTSIAIIAAAILVSCIILSVIYVFFRDLRRKLESARAQLEEAATTDALTGIRNRRFALESLNAEIAEAGRTQAPLCCAIADADDFKRVNDELGHGSGDQALKAIASILAAGVRPYDLAGRYGGEEFILVFPHTSKAEALAACERLRRDVEAQAGPRVPGLRRPLTISIGIAELQNGDGEADALLDRADGALYRAKAAGKNRCASQEEARR